MTTAETATEILERTIGRYVTQIVSLQAKIAELEEKLKAPEPKAPEPITNKYHD